MGRKTKEPRMPAVIERKTTSGLTSDALAAVRREVPDGAAVDASLKSAGLRVLEVEVPLVEEATGYLRRLVDLDLTLEEAEILRRIDLALDLQGARLNDGRKVNGQAAAVRWILQRVGERAAVVEL